MNPIEKIEQYILDYVSFDDRRIALVLAVWSVATHIFDKFDAFPYLVITSHTKRSGKTRCSEIISFLSRNPKNFAAMTAPTLFRVIESKPTPTIVFDEAEALSGESASTMRAVLNVGYRKGQTIPRSVPGTNEIIEYNTYCPKIFILIGDVYDTLRDRSIVITLKRAEVKKRFRFDLTAADGQILRDEAVALLKETDQKINDLYHNESLCEYLSDRDAEIWTSILAIGKILLPPGRYEELRTVAVDLCAEKTAKKKRYSQMEIFEDQEQNDEYAKRILLDLGKVFGADEKSLFSTEAVERLKGLQLAPWRKFRGPEGISENGLAELLSRFGVRPVSIRRKKEVRRGYFWENVHAAISSL